ncbi:type IV secretion protein Rhs [Achromobacter sp. RTa]|uniref:type VI secretion system Vgr family protein n=1 Tax=Achromobacter sp. RTa TaxID=1532557 RepID=UPI00050E01B3|nr:type VI secretion system Vgr family protein [Achromobacter sp. RTa]KGD90362.1 type IV secretion protein Rhs [Achromobacter sp. RTa]
MPQDSFGLSSLPTAGVEQANRLLNLSTPLGENRMVAETLSAREQLSGGACRLDITALSDDAHIPLKSLLGQPVALRLQTALDREQPRIWHGHVTAAEFRGANGGMARYALTVEPWLAFLRARRDSFAYQDKTVFDIVESIFGDYKGQGTLAPQWRWDVKDRSSYPKRSLTIQYRETDYVFVERLLAEEGLFYWVEHEADGHTLVIADHNGAFKPGAQASVRFARADVTETEDSIQQWSQRKRWQTNAVRMASWDYRSAQARPVAAQAAGAAGQALELASNDYPGQYAYEDGAQGERLAHNALAAIRVRQESYEGAGTVRTLAPGQRFELTGHFQQGGPSAYVVIAMTHQARNNFDADLGRAVSEAQSGAGGQADADFYANAFTCIGVDTEFRPATQDGHGARLHPRPTVFGAQTALVVGAEDPVHTDRDHRIKVQFHWQRGKASSSRLTHPSGDENAPAKDELGTWVRVAEPVAGGDWGGHFVPRLGQEVLVEFLHGDIDRPVVVGALYNGEGAEDASHNQVQAGGANATGNAPAWFAGGNEGHAHNVVMSGFKTQALSSSGAGTGGYNQLVQDDTPGQSRLTASTTQADARLNLGHIKQQRDNERLDDLGHGAELSTKEAVAVRAGSGLLISADLRENADGALLDSAEAAKQIESAMESAQDLADTAVKQKAVLDGDPETLPAQEALKHILDVVEATQEGPGGEAPGVQVAAYSEPHMQVSAPSGIGQYTAADAFLVAGNTFAQVAPDVNWASSANVALGVAGGAVLFTLGLAPSGSRAVKGQGLRLHAAGGKLRLHSQDAKMTLSAEKAVTVASADASVMVEAKQRLLATAGGAYLRVEGGGIQLHAPGKVELKAGLHSWVGPEMADTVAPLPKGDLKLCDFKMSNADGDAIVPVG